MRYFFSSATNAFYPYELKSSYVESKSWPDDAIEVSADIAEQFMGEPPEGHMRAGDSDGMPCWTPVPPLSTDELISIAEHTRSGKLAVAMQTISIWQTKLQLGRITDDEKRQLNTWLDYIDAVNAVDTSLAPNIQWPTPPTELAKQ